jgi:hypothetical protein
MGDDVNREIGSMWPAGSPPCSVLDPVSVPEPCRAYYVANGRGRWILDDVLGHIRSVQTPPPLVPVYQIRQYSHRRAAFLRRDLLVLDELAHLPRYPQSRDEYQRWPNADAVRGDLLYDAAGRLYDEYGPLWGS